MYFAKIKLNIGVIVAKWSLTHTPSANRLWKNIYLNLCLAMRSLEECKFHYNVDFTKQTFPSPLTDKRAPQTNPNHLPPLEPLLSWRLANDRLIVLSFDLEKTFIITRHLIDRSSCHGNHVVMARCRIEKGLEFAPTTVIKRYSLKRRAAFISEWNAELSVLNFLPYLLLRTKHVSVYVPVQI